MSSSHLRFGFTISLELVLTDLFSRLVAIQRYNTGGVALGQGLNPEGLQARTTWLIRNV